MPPPTLADRECRDPAPKSGSAMFRRLESLEEELSPSMVYTGSTRWMIPYADLLTVLLGVLLVLLAVSQADSPALKSRNKSQGKPQTQEHPAQTETQQSLQEQQATQRTRDEELSALRQQLAQLSHLRIIPADASMGTSGRDAKTKNPARIPGGQGHIRISQEERGLVISMEDRVLFASGSADLPESSEKTLDQLAKALKITSYPIRIEGHTDDSPIATPQFPSNWELSTARATNIVRYLVKAHGFKPTRLSAAGYGEYRPLVANSSIQGKQKNRRVDIVILNAQAARWEPPGKTAGEEAKEGAGEARERTGLYGQTYQTQGRQAQGH